MQKSTKAKIVGGATAIVMACGLAVAGSSMTSAYFSDTNSGGKMTASYGSIQVDVEGNKVTTPSLAWEDVLPGQSKTVDFDITNSGNSAQDAWIKFDKTALALVNTYGTYAGFTISVDGVDKFHSKNLNGQYVDGPLVAEGDAANGLREQIRLVEDLAPKDTANVKVTFHFHEKNKIGKPVVLPYSVIATQPGIAPGA